MKTEGQFFRNAGRLAVMGILIASIADSARAAPNLALTFDGVEDHVLAPSRAAFELTDGTLELWFKPDWTPGSINHDPVLIANRLGPALTRYSLQVDRNLAGVILANGTTSSSVPWYFLPGEWVHLAVSESGPSAQVYVNGRLAGSTANGFGTLIGLPLNLGADGVGQFFLGAIDEVRIWNIPRSATEIRRNLTRALAGTEAGLVAYWRCDEESGGTLVDSTANRFDAQVVGASWTVSAVSLINRVDSLGWALDMAADRGTHIRVNPSPSLAVNGQFTCEAWIKPRSAACGTILTRGHGINLAFTDYILAVGTDGTNCGGMKLALMVGGTWIASESAVPLNEWTHVAATFNGTNRALYLNGVLDRAVSGGQSAFIGSLLTFLGKQGTAGSNYFDGAMDEVRVWNRARTPTEVLSGMTRKVAAGESGLAACWRFDDESGIQALDASGWRNHGILMNRPRRVNSLWTPQVTVAGANPLTHECHVPPPIPVVTVGGQPIAIAGGSDHGVVTKADGETIAWGNYLAGQTNVPSTVSNVIALAAGNRFTLALKTDGAVTGWGSNGDGQSNPPASATNGVAVAAGDGHSVVLRADGTVIAWGWNGSGQTNVPPSATNVVALDAGSDHNVVLKADGSLVGWGNNTFGQCSIPATATNVVAVSAGGQHTLALTADGRVLAWGRNDFGQVNVPAAASNVVSIAAGQFHSLALKADGAVIAWGSNAYGQLDVPGVATNLVNIAAGGTFSVALTAEGSVITWGVSPNGNISVPPGVTRLDLPTTVRGAVNSDVPGAYNLFYSATNSLGSVGIMRRTVLVTDTTPPVIALNGANPWNVDLGFSFLDPGAVASDSCAGDLTVNIVRSGTVNINVPGRNTITYTVMDPSGNSTTTNRTVLVRSLPAVLGFTAFFYGTNEVTGSPVVQFLADVNPNGAATTTFAAYGLNTTYPGRTASVNLPASFDTSTFYATLDGLIPGATYHFRIAASNLVGVTYGPDRTFTVPLLFAPGDVNGDGRVDSSELNTVLSNYWPSNLVMSNLTTTGGGLLQFSLTNGSEWSFTMMMSTNLVDWMPLPSPALSVWQFLDETATNQPKRFYRLRWP